MLNLIFINFIIQHEKKSYAPVGEYALFLLLKCSTNHKNDILLVFQHILLKPFFSFFVITIKNPFLRRNYLFLLKKLLFLNIDFQDPRIEHYLIETRWFDVHVGSCIVSYYEVCCCQRTMTSIDSYHIDNDRMLVFFVRLFRVFIVRYKHEKKTRFRIKYMYIT